MRSLIAYETWRDGCKSCARSYIVICIELPMNGNDYDHLIVIILIFMMLYNYCLEFMIIITLIMMVSCHIYETMRYISHGYSSFTS